MLVPGLNYNFETLVECISEMGVADQIRWVARGHVSHVMCHVATLAISGIVMTMASVVTLL